MPEIFKVSCECGKHDFVFSTKPWQKTEVKCPKCEQVTVFDPAEKFKEKTKKGE